VASLDGAGWVLDPRCLDVDVPDGMVVTLAIAEGRLAGSGGCNRYSCACLPSSDGDLDLGPVLRTMMACLPPILAVEDAFLARLDRVSGYRFTGDDLELLADGEPVLRFEPGDPPTDG
jgi:heat shock protein HslJ